MAYVEVQSLGVSGMALLGGSYRRLGDPYSTTIISPLPWDPEP